MSAPLNIGDPAPDFSAIAIGGAYKDGEKISLSDFRGRNLVLYFYPKDDTPGCTVQACGVRDAWHDLNGRAAVFGVSADVAASHRKFIDKYHLPFPLLSDSERKIVNDYGVWVEKTFMGRKHMGIERTTFVIDPEGKISAIFRKVKPDQHAGLLEEALGLK